MESEGSLTVFPRICLSLSESGHHATPPLSLSYFLKTILILSSKYTPGSSKLFLILGFLHQNPACISLLPIYGQYATCPAHLILLDLVTRILCGETYRSLYIIKECNSKPNASTYHNEAENRSMHNFNGASVDCS